MSAVHVSGIPSQLKLSKISIIFKSILRKHGAPNQFWIKEMEDIRGTYLKSLKMEFQSVTDAYDAAEILDGYKLAEADHPLTASIEEVRRRSPSPYRRRSRDEYYGRRDFGRRMHSRGRSRSPILREASQLDMEIELLKKQRMIIEEERRLIMERKKLELVQEFGPRAIREFRPLEEERDRRYRGERSAERWAENPRRPRPLPRSRPLPGPSRAEGWSAGSQRDRIAAKLPQFNLPCKILIREMYDLVEKHKDETEHPAFLLVKFMKTTLRKRIAVALEGKPIMSGSKIAQLYREKYPKNLDEDFVLQHVKELKSLHMPGKGKSTKEKSAGDSKENVKQEKTETNGKPESDTASQEDAKAINVKAEPDTPNQSMEEEKTTKDQEENTTEDPPVASEQPDSEDHEEMKDGDKRDEESVTSSDALALHDVNDEDWVQGEHDWAEDAAQEE